MMLFSRVLTVNNLGWVDFYTCFFIVLFMGIIVLSIDE